MTTRPMRHTGTLSIVLATLLSFVAGADAADRRVTELENARVATIKQISPSVVAIFSSDGGGGGSGVLISPDGYALSNYHVTSACGDFMKCGLNDGKLYDAVIVGIDQTGDVALIKLLGRDDFPYATFGDSDELKVGDSVYVVGNPFLLAADFQPTVTYGIVSGTHRYQYPSGTYLEYTDCIQVDASINPGNSGGPLFNSRGELVGINGRASFGIEKRGRVNVGAGYAISINQIEHFLDHLHSGRIVDHATLGAAVTTAGDGAIVVSNILESSEAFRRGLRQGDELVSFAGRPIRSVNQFKNILGIYPKGWRLPLVYRREGRKQEIIVRLRGLHSQSEILSGGPLSKRPQPEENPDEKSPEEGKPLPLPHDHSAEPARDVPQQYAKLFEARPGFANYYFNHQKQKQLLSALARMGDFRSATGVWRISGRIEGDEKFEFTLADRGLGLELGEKAYFQPLDGSNMLDEPPQSGGLLAAMHHLRLLLTMQSSGFTEFYYLGSEPLDGGGPRVDVLVTVIAGSEARWYFDKTDGAMLGFDMSLSEDTDDCQIRFLEFAAFDHRRMPSKLLVRGPEREFATFDIDAIDWSASRGSSGEGVPR